MKKSDRHLTILMNMRDQRLNATATGDVREWQSSYDVAQGQSITQPNAWRLLKELVSIGFVHRNDNVEDVRGTVRYTLSEAGNRFVNNRRIARRNAMKRLIEYKTRKYRKGLKL